MKFFKVTFAELNCCAYEISLAPVAQQHPVTCGARIPATWQHIRDPDRPRHTTSSHTARTRVLIVSNVCQLKLCIFEVE
jgi:hypothetical protein